MDQSSIEILKLLSQIPFASTITSLLLVFSFVWTTGISIKKNYDKKHSDMLEVINVRLDGIEREVLKLQLLSGIDQERLSISETMYFYDKYKQLGGNSFVSHHTENYIKKLEEKGVDKQ